MRNLCVFLILFTIIIHESSGQNLVWAHSFGDDDNDLSSFVTTDKLGNVYITGRFKGTVDFDPGPDTQLVSADPTMGSAFVQKLDASGNLCWVRILYRTLHRYPTYRVFVDDSLNVFTCGSRWILSTTLQKLNPEGEIIWTKILPAPYSIFGDMDLDKEGNIYLSGSFSDCIVLDTQNWIENPCSNGRMDNFIWKLDKSGDHLWIRSLGGNRDDNGYAMTVDPFGNVYSSGHIRGRVDMNPGSGSYFLGNGNSVNAYIQKLNKHGQFLWAKAFKYLPLSMESDLRGNLLVGGSFSGKTDFDSGPDTTFLRAVGYEDMFLQKLSPQGDLIWAERMGGGLDDRVYGLSIDALGNSYVSGNFYKISPDSTYPFIYHQDILVQKRNPNGNLLWEFELSGKTNNNGYGIHADQNGYVYITGEITDTVDFDPSPGSYNLSASDHSNIFIAKYSDRQIVGVEQLISSPLVIYPNPGNGLLTVFYKENRRLKAFQLINLDGKVLLEGEIDALPFELDARAFPSGIYVLQMKDDQGGILIKKIQIQ